MISTAQRLVADLARRAAKRTAFLVLTGLAVLLLAAALTACQQPSNATTDNNSSSTGTSDSTGDSNTSSSTSSDRVILQQGMKAPDFAFTTVDGMQGKLSDYQGKVVFINFWASWCGPCMQEMPDIAKLQQSHSDVVFFEINVSDNPTNAQSYIDSSSLKANWVIDDGTIFYQYPSDGIPYTLIVNPDGVITKIFIGSPTDAYNTFTSALQAAGAS